jgi:hypothetical protein
MSQFWITLLSITAGAVGYLIVTFWVQPILKYREIKYRVAADLVFFANALDLLKSDRSFRKDTEQRQENNRRCASDFEATVRYLPRWYRWWLKWRNENPMEASRDLFGLANSDDSKSAKQYIAEIRKNLKIPKYETPT